LSVAATFIHADSEAGVFPGFFILGGFNRQDGL